MWWAQEGGKWRKRNEQQTKKNDVEKTCATGKFSNPAKDKQIKWQKRIGFVHDHVPCRS